MRHPRDALTALHVSVAKESRVTVASGRNELRSVTCELSGALGLGSTLQSLSLELTTHSTSREFQLPPTLFKLVFANSLGSRVLCKQLETKTLQGANGYTVAPGFHPSSRELCVQCSSFLGWWGAGGERP